MSGWRRYESRWGLAEVRERCDPGLTECELWIRRNVWGQFILMAKGYDANGKWCHLYLTRDGWISQGIAAEPTNRIFLCSSPLRTVIFSINSKLIEWSERRGFLGEFVFWALWRERKDGTTHEETHYDVVSSGPYRVGDEALVAGKRLPIQPVACLGTLTHVDEGPGYIVDTPTDADEPLVVRRKGSETSDPGVAKVSG